MLVSVSLPVPPTMVMLEAPEALRESLPVPPNMVIKAAAAGRQEGGVAGNYWCRVGGGRDGGRICQGVAETRACDGGDLISAVKKAVR